MVENLTFCNTELHTINSVFLEYFCRIMSGVGCCKNRGPGYANPMDAFKNSEKEKLLYIPCIVPTKDRPDYLVTIDVDENSRDYGKVNLEQSE